jgi:hypothetical protein
MCSINYQCSSITKNNCQCKNRVTVERGFCTKHSKKEANVIQIINSFNNINVEPKNTVIPENIYVNGKFIPNVNKLSVKPSTMRASWTGITSCGKTPDEMNKYIFPFN